MNNSNEFQTSFLEKIYIANIKEPSSREIESTMDENSSHALNITGTLFVLYLLCAIGFYISPVLVFALFQMEEPLLPIYIPFADVTTREGYMVTSIYHYVIIYIACVCLAFIDALFFNLVFNVLTMAELQCNQQSKLNDELGIKEFPVSAIRIRLVNFFKMNQEMEK